MGHSRRPCPTVRVIALFFLLDGNRTRLTLIPGQHFPAHVYPQTSPDMGRSFLLAKEDVVHGAQPRVLSAPPLSSLGQQQRPTGRSSLHPRRPTHNILCTMLQGAGRTSHTLCTLSRDRQSLLLVMYVVLLRQTVQGSRLLSIQLARRQPRPTFTAPQSPMTCLVIIRFTGLLPRHIASQCRR